MTLTQRHGFEKLREVIVNFHHDNARRCRVGKGEMMLGGKQQSNIVLGVEVEEDDSGDRMNGL